MKIFVSENPSQEAGEYITSHLHAHYREATLLLLSGGSAFDILNWIDMSRSGPNVLVGLVDDRYTNDEGNNFVQLQMTAFYKRALERNILFIDSRPHGHETRELLILRMNEEIDAFKKSHPEHYALGLFGIGEDGHTASIFPASEIEFEEMYTAQEFFIPSHTELVPYKDRITVNPTVIEDMLNDVVLYAVGEQKCNTVLKQMHTRSFEDYELPVLIPARHPQSALFTDCNDIV